MIIVPAISRNGWVMQVSQFPDRKKKALTVSHAELSFTYVLGYFTSDRHAEMFSEFINGDLTDAMERIWKK